MRTYLILLLLFSAAFAAYNLSIAAIEWEFVDRVYNKSVQAELIVQFTPIPCGNYINEVWRGNHVNIDLSLIKYTFIDGRMIEWDVKKQLTYDFVKGQAIANISVRVTIKRRVLNITNPNLMATYNISAIIIYDAWVQLVIYDGYEIVNLHDGESIVRTVDFAWNV